jgi:hypothetical protein
VFYKFNLFIKSLVYGNINTLSKKKTMRIEKQHKEKAPAFLKAPHRKGLFIK